MQSTPLNQPSKVLHRLLLLHHITVQGRKVGSGRLVTDGGGVGLDGAVQRLVNVGRVGGCRKKY